MSSFTAVLVPHLQIEEKKGVIQLLVNLDATVVEFLPSCYSWITRQTICVTKSIKLVTVNCVQWISAQICQGE